LNPFYKEITQVFDGMNESQVAEAGRRLQDIINLGKQFRAEVLSQPAGQVVSCVPANRKVASKHKKQSRFTTHL